MSDQVLTVAALILSGYILLALEILVVPGVGIVGFSGFGCLAAGCALAFLWFDPVMATALIAGVVGGTTVLLWWLPKTPLGRGVVHRKSLPAGSGNAVAVEPGRVGVADSDLRPSGVGRFGEVRQSVVTEGEFIARGAAIEVTEIHGARVVVEAVVDAAPEAS